MPASISSSAPGGSRWSISTAHGSTSCCCSASPSRTATTMPERGLRSPLDNYTVGDPDELLPLRVLLAGLGRRAYGMLLFAPSVPAFIPIQTGARLKDPPVVRYETHLIVGPQGRGVARDWERLVEGERGRE